MTMNLANLALTIAAILHPGTNLAKARVIRTIAEVVENDHDPLGSTENELALAIEFAYRESDFGRALSGRRWDSLAYGVLQVRGNPELETDLRGNVRAWLAILHDARRRCGEDLAVAGLASGQCDRGVKLAEARKREALFALEVAGYRENQEERDESHEIAIDFRR
jgi:hypothetical protein